MEKLELRYWASASTKTHSAYRLGHVPNGTLDPLITKEKVLEMANKIFGADVSTQILGEEEKDRYYIMIGILKGSIAAHHRKRTFEAFLKALEELK